MESVDLQQMPYFEECAKIVSAMGFFLVELSITRQREAAQVAAVIAGQGDVGIEDCAAVHQVLQARLEALLGTSDLQMQVSSPGITRTLRHAGEFACFEGRMARAWHIPSGGWVEGRIASSTDKSVIIDGKEGARELPYSEISKAKLLG